MKKRLRLRMYNSDIRSYIDHYRQLHVQFVVGLIALAEAVVVLTRLILTGWQGTYYIGWFILLAFTVMYFMIRNGHFVRYSAMVAVGLLIVQLMLLGLVSGGLDAPTVVTIALIPILATMLVSRRAGWICVVLCLLYVGLITTMKHYNITLPETPLTRYPSDIVKGAVIAVVLVIINAIAWFYHAMNEELNEHILSQSSLDHATGIANRREIDEILLFEIKRARRANSIVSIILIEVDHFSDYVEFHGRTQASACLKRIAAQIKLSLQRPEDVVGRFIGESFLVVLPGTAMKGAEQVAQSIRSSIPRLQEFYGGDLDNVLTVSGGMAGGSGTDLPEPKVLIKRAEQALNLSKQSGNRITLEDPIQQQDLQPSSSLSSHS